MKRPVVVLLTVAYLASLWVIFLGVKQFDSFARDAWYTHVTRRLVSRSAHVPVGACIVGIYKPELPYSLRLMRQLEDTLGMRFSIISFYQAWGSDPMHRFQPILMDNVADNGAVPMVTWEPWVNGFTNDDLPPMPDREWRSLRAIAEGTYDFYITEWARAAVTWGKPFFLRFAHEMTNPQYPWTPTYGNTVQDFLDAWWHVHSIFSAQGATNVIWVWSPWGTGVLEYYPGDDYVDWVAMDIFNYGELLFGQGRRWMSFDELASPLYKELVTLRKPILVAEVGCSDIGGSRDVWYDEMLTHIRTTFTHIKAVILFENPADRTSGRWTIDWSIGPDAYTRAAVRNQFAQGYYHYVDDYLQRLSGLSPAPGGLP